MTYLACALIPVPKAKVDDYRKLAEQVSRFWIEHGALRYRDFVGDDLDVADRGAVPFPNVAGLAEDETLVLATLEFGSRDHRAEVEAKVQKDPRVGELMADGMPFDPSRMAHGGFAAIVER